MANFTSPASSGFSVDSDSVFDTIYARYESALIHCINRYFPAVIPTPNTASVHCVRFPVDADADVDSMLRTWRRAVVLSAESSGVRLSAFVRHSEELLGTILVMGSGTSKVDGSNSKSTVFTISLSGPESSVLNTAAPGMLPVLPAASVVHSPREGPISYVLNTVAIAVQSYVAKGSMGSLPGQPIDAFAQLCIRFCLEEHASYPHVVQSQGMFCITSLSKLSGGRHRGFAAIAARNVLDSLGTQLDAMQVAKTKQEKTDSLVDTPHLLQCLRALQVLFEMDWNSCVSSGPEEVVRASIVGFLQRLRLTPRRKCRAVAQFRDAGLVLVLCVLRRWCAACTEAFGPAIWNDLRRELEHWLDLNKTLKDCIYGVLIQLYAREGFNSPESLSGVLSELETLVIGAKSRRTKALEWVLVLLEESSDQLLNKEIIPLVRKFVEGGSLFECEDRSVCVRILCSLCRRCFPIGAQSLAHVLAQATSAQVKQQRQLHLKRLLIVVRSVAAMSPGQPLGSMDPVDAACPKVLASLPAEYETLQVGLARSIVSIVQEYCTVASDDEELVQLLEYALKCLPMVIESLKDDPEKMAEVMSVVGQLLLNPNARLVSGAELSLPQYVVSDPGRNCVLTMNLLISYLTRYDRLLGNNSLVQTLFRQCRVVLQAFNDIVTETDAHRIFGSTSDESRSSSAIVGLHDPELWRSLRVRFEAVMLTWYIQPEHRTGALDLLRLLATPAVRNIEMLYENVEGDFVRLQLNKAGELVGGIPGQQPPAPYLIDYLSSGHADQAAEASGSGEAAAQTTSNIGDPSTTLPIDRERGSSYEGKQPASSAITQSLSLLLTVDFELFAETIKWVWRQTIARWAALHGRIADALFPAHSHTNSMGEDAKKAFYASTGRLLQFLCTSLMAVAFVGGSGHPDPSDHELSMEEFLRDLLRLCRSYPVPRFHRQVVKSLSCVHHVAVSSRSVEMILAMLRRPTLQFTHGVSGNPGNWVTVPTVGQSNAEWMSPTNIEYGLFPGTAEVGHGAFTTDMYYIISKWLELVSDSHYVDTPIRTLCDQLSREQWFMSAAEATMAASNHGGKTSMDVNRTCALWSLPNGETAGDDGPLRLSYNCRIYAIRVLSLHLRRLPSAMVAVTDLRRAALRFLDAQYRCCFKIAERLSMIGDGSHDVPGTPAASVASWTCDENKLMDSMLSRVHDAVARALRSVFDAGRLSDEKLEGQALQFLNALLLDVTLDCNGNSSYQLEVPCSPVFEALASFLRQNKQFFEEFVRLSFFNINAGVVQTPVSSPSVSSTISKNDVVQIAYLWALVRNLEEDMDGWVSGPYGVSRPRLLLLSAIQQGSHSTPVLRTLGLRIAHALAHLLSADHVRPSTQLPLVTHPERHVYVHVAVRYSSECAQQYWKWTPDIFRYAADVLSPCADSDTLLRMMVPWGANFGRLVSQHVERTPTVSPRSRHDSDSPHHEVEHDAVARLSLDHDGHRSRSRSRNRGQTMRLTDRSPFEAFVCMFKLTKEYYAQYPDLVAKLWSAEFVGDGDTVTAVSASPLRGPNGAAKESEGIDFDEDTLAMMMQFLLDEYEQTWLSRPVNVRVQQLCKLILSSFVRRRRRRASIMLTQLAEALRDYPSEVADDPIALLQLRIKPRTPKSTVDVLNATHRVRREGITNREHSAFQMVASIVYEIASVDELEEWLPLFLCNALVVFGSAASADGVSYPEAGQLIDCIVQQVQEEGRELDRSPVLAAGFGQAATSSQLGSSHESGKPSGQQSKSASGSTSSWDIGHYIDTIYHSFSARREYVLRELIDLAYRWAVHSSDDYIAKASWNMLAALPGAFGTLAASNESGETTTGGDRLQTLLCCWLIAGHSEYAALQDELLGIVSHLNIEDILDVDRFRIVFALLSGALFVGDQDNRLQAINLLHNLLKVPVDHALEGFQADGEPNAISISCCETVMSVLNTLSGGSDGSRLSRARSGLDMDMDDLSLEEEEPTGRILSDTTVVRALFHGFSRRSTLIASISVLEHVLLMQGICRNRSQDAADGILIGENSAVAVTVMVSYAYLTVLMSRDDKLMMDWFEQHDLVYLFDMLDHLKLIDSSLSPQLERFRAVFSEYLENTIGADDEAGAQSSGAATHGGESPDFSFFCSFWKSFGDMFFAGSANTDEEPCDVEAAGRASVVFQFVVELLLRLLVDGVEDCKDVLAKLFHAFLVEHGSKMSDVSPDLYEEMFREIIRGVGNDGHKLVFERILSDVMALPTPPGVSEDACTDTDGRGLMSPVDSEDGELGETSPFELLYDFGTVQSSWCGYRILFESGLGLPFNATSVRLHCHTSAVAATVNESTDILSAPPLTVPTMVEYYVEEASRAMRRSSEDVK